MSEKKRLLPKAGFSPGFVGKQELSDASQTSGLQGFAEKQKRLFFAVNLPEKVKKEISGKLLPLVPAGAWGKVQEQNLHITMLFLGYMDASAVERLQQQASALKSTQGFEAELKGVGDFNGRVLWVGIEKGAHELEQLAEQLQQAVGAKDERFHPHITLGR
ncbi:MAG: RNA 2',3'-cyclic phosphodiesterase, partial [Candidatus Diapherotrites archaeon]|nr:RNA 2',3'-cyclic phosphodiesterase [Candidatus Diapherotrites archaeon]